MDWQTLSLHFKQTYEGGYRYLDRCGEFMLAAAEKMDFIPGEAKPTGGKMELPESGVNVAFDTVALSLNQELPGPETGFMVGLCKGLTALIAEHFRPKSILRNGFAWKSYWPFSKVDEMLAASLKLGVGDYAELGKMVGMKPNNQKLYCFFSSGSFDLEIMVEPVTFERVNFQRRNANFRAHRLEKCRVQRMNQFADQFNSDLEHAIVLTVDLIENDPPAHQSLENHFHALKAHNQTLRSKFKPL